MNGALQFDWDERNAGHIARHTVTPAQVEQVFANKPVFVAQEQRGGELRSVIVGRTNAGRVLAVVWTPRSRKVRVVTAYSASKRMREFYRARKGG